VSSGGGDRDEVPTNLARFGYLSLATGIVVFAMKLAAFAVTGSVGLLSDALESTVNIVAALVAIVALRAAAKPGDHDHHFGHGKAEYISALVEGVMIFVAAILIIWTAVDRILHPRPLESLGIGVAISVAASLVNGAVAWILIREGRRHGSIVLEADGKHLLTDVWTSAGVVVAVGLVALTGWQLLDPVIAIVVGLNIVYAGSVLVRDSTSGLMDSALSDDEHRVIVATLRRFASAQVRFHAVQTRRSGRQRFVSFHMLVPGQWTVRRGHDLVEEVEAALKARLPWCVVQSHLEPLEDPRSWQDIPSGGLGEQIGGTGEQPAVDPG
jgi:cation diffusion facilitator family transporter